MCPHISLPSKARQIFASNAPFPACSISPTIRAPSRPEVLTSCLSVSCVSPDALLQVSNISCESLTAYCVPPTACCLLPTAFCLLPNAFRLPRYTSSHNVAEQGLQPRE